MKFAEGAGVEDEDHVEEFGVGVVRVDGEVGAGDSDAVTDVDSGDVGQRRKRERKKTLVKKPVPLRWRSRRGGSGFLDSLCLS